MATANRSREGDVADAARVEDAGDGRMIDGKGLHEAWRRARLGECTRELIGDERRLGCVLHENGIPRENASDERVDRNEERVVPRGDDEDDADRYALDAPAKPS